MLVHGRMTRPAGCEDCGFAWLGLMRLRHWEQKFAKPGNIVYDNHSHLQ
jgi:hypothetical protein